MDGFVNASPRRRRSSSSSFLRPSSSWSVSCTLRLVAFAPSPLVLPSSSSWSVSYTLRLVALPPSPLVLLPSSSSWSVSYAPRLVAFAPSPLVLRPSSSWSAGTLPRISTRVDGLVNASSRRRRSSSSSSSAVFTMAGPVRASSRRRRSARSRHSFAGGSVVALAQAPRLRTSPVWLVLFRFALSPRYARSLCSLARNGVRGMLLRARRFDLHPGCVHPV